MAKSDEYHKGEQRGRDSGQEDANYPYGGKPDAERAFGARIGNKAWAREHADYHAGFVAGYVDGAKKRKK